MGCGWWNPPTPYKEDCYWYREEQDMNARIPHCPCTNQFPLNSCENCEDYHSRSKRTQGDKIRAMTDEQFAHWLVERVTDSPWCKPDAPVDPETKRCQIWDCEKCALEWLRQEAGQCTK